MATAVRVQPFMAMLAALPTLGTVIGSTYRSHRGSKANSYILALAPTGSGKENPRRLGQQLLHSLQMSLCIGAQTLGSDSGFEREMSKGDAVWYLDEFNTVLRDWRSKNCPAYRMNIKDLMLNCFGGERYTGKALKDAAEQIIIESPMPSIFATAQPTSFYEMMDMSLIETGFINRFMIFNAARVEKQDFDRKIKLVPETMPQSLVDYCKESRKQEANAAMKIMNYARPIIRMSLKTSAHVLFRQLAVQKDSVFVQAHNDGEHIRAAIVARTMEKTEHLALIHHWSKDFRATDMDADSIEWAYKIACISDHTISHHCPLIRITESEYERDYSALLDKVRKSGPAGVRASDLVRARKIPKARFDDIVLNMRRAGQVDARQSGSNVRYFYLDKAADDE